MEEESMEEEGGSSSSYEAMMDDQNHNNWEAGVDGYRQQPPTGHAQAPLGDRPLDRKGPRGQQQQEAAEEIQMVPEANGLLRGCDSAAAKGGAVAAATININTSTSKFLMNVITIEDYKSTYWPKLDSAIDQLLTQSPGDYIPISYEQIYSCVYKCVCQQHSEQMYSDLIKKITNHLERVSKELQASPPDLYIERFNIALGQYMGALQSIVPLFIYMEMGILQSPPCGPVCSGARKHDEDSPTLSLGAGTGCSSSRMSLRVLHCGCWACPGAADGGLSEAVSGWTAHVAWGSRLSHTFLGVRSGLPPVLQDRLRLQTLRTALFTSALGD
ncbi:CDK2-associated and cullin domain-containing protein 1 isoform X2 [Pelodiscus sinensis]|uniref:CDK2-associated and cullin domain-containing protein 1 isoform X2 n=1 Tax=Pelodiscus sinensis TaxID=13735 RepID=UPI003F6BD3AD